MQSTQTKTELIELLEYLSSAWEWADFLHEAITHGDLPDAMIDDLFALIHTAIETAHERDQQDNMQKTKEFIEKMHQQERIEHDANGNELSLLTRSL
jgi:hypothetical protein